MCNLQEREPIWKSSQPMCWSKMSIHCSEDHYSRDPVQVQSHGHGFQRGTGFRSSRLRPLLPAWQHERTPRTRMQALTEQVQQRQLGSVVEYWGTRPRKNSEIHIDVSHSRQPLVKGERLVRYEVNTVMHEVGQPRVPNFEFNDCNPWLKAQLQPKRQPWQTGRRTSVPQQHAIQRWKAAASCRGLLKTCRRHASLTRGSLGVLLLAKCQARATRESV
jgi:hypothetical protein